MIACKINQMKFEAFCIEKSILYMRNGELIVKAEDRFAVYNSEFREVWTQHSSPVVCLQ